MGENQAEKKWEKGGGGYFTHSIEAGVPMTN